MQNKFYVYKIAFIVSIGGLLLGISANVSGASEFYRGYFNLKVGSFLEGLGVSIAMLATFIGNFYAGALADKIGRKKALLVSAFLFSFCTLGSALAINYTLFLISRFIGGLGIGISLLVVPLFIAEFSPQKKRGFLVSFNQLNITIGFLLAYFINAVVINMVTDNELIWRWMLGVGFIFPVVYILLMLFVPESPRWLLGKGKSGEAKAILTKIGGIKHAEKELQEILRSTETDSNKRKTSYRELLPLMFSQPMRLVLLVALSVAFFQMASGLNSVLFFVPRIFRMAGFGSSGSFFMPNLVGITMVVMTIVSMFAIDRLGRKPLLLIGVSVMAVSILVSAWAFNNSYYLIEKRDIDRVTSAIENTPEKQIVLDALVKISKQGKQKEKAFFTSFKNEILAETGDKKQAEKIYSEQRGALLDASISIKSVLVMITILGFVIGFSISLGPITWALLSEIFPGQLRGLGISIAGTLNALTSFIVTTIFPIELEVIGVAATFLIYGVLLLVFIVLVIRWYPETKGKSLEEIERMMVRKD